MLEAFQSLLAQIRTDRSAWSETAHHPFHLDDGHVEDSNYRKRYGVLLCLQYDRRDEDDALLRYLLSEEVESRRSDPFQGVSSALPLAAYLLACRQRVEDVRLLWQAKSANFDTYCAIETMHLFAAGTEQTLAYLEMSDHPEDQELLQSLRDRSTVLDIPTQEEMDEFYRQKQRAYPEDPSQEDELTLAQRAWELDQVEEGRLWLDKWEARQPVTANTLNILMHTRDMLGQPKQALKCAQRLLETAETDIGFASAQFSAGRCAVAAGEYDQAWEMLKQIIQALENTPERQFHGQHLATLELALSIAKSVPPDHALRSAGLQLAHSLMQQGYSTSYNLLRGASEVARSLGDPVLERHYRDLAEEEHKRIQRQLSG